MVNFKSMRCYLDGSGSNNGMSNDQGKKTKFVPIYSQDGKAAEAVQLPGSVLWIEYCQFQPKCFA